MKAIGIVQARMGSTRLPGKVLMPIGGVTMLERVLGRIEQACSLCQVGVATSTHPEDESILEFCEKRGTFCYRGSEGDVLERFFLAAKEMRGDAIVRITGDCPLVDPKIIDTVVNTHIESQNDFTFNDVVKSYPRGTDVEVVNYSVLEYTCRTARDSYHREHVTAYIYDHPDRFKIQPLHLPLDLRTPELRLCVDEMSDLVLVERIFEHFSPGSDFSLSEIMECLNLHPELREINRNVKQVST